MIKIKQLNLHNLIHFMMTLIVISIFGFFLLLSACNEAEIEPVTKEINEPVKPKIPEVVREDPDDKSSYDMPRFQFKGTLKGRDKYEIWSIKIDGTDLRLAISADELYAGGYSDLRPYIQRSPDGRYVLLVQQPDNGMNSRVLYNIKTHERTTIIKKGAVNPSIRWLEDSKNVLFYSWSDDDSKANLYQYNVDTKKLTTRPIINSYEYYPVKKDTEFVAISDEGFEIYDWEGKVKNKKVTFSKKINEVSHSVSRNGQYLVYKYTRGIDPAFVVINIKKPHEQLYSYKGRTKYFMFNYSGGFLYFEDRTGIFKLNVHEKVKKLILPYNKLGHFLTLGHVQLYNDFGN